MKVRISYQHVTGHSAYDQEFVGEGPDMIAARHAAQVAANRTARGLALPLEFNWENRVPQGDGMVTVMYDF